MAGHSEERAGKGITVTLPGKEAGGNPAVVIMCGWVGASDRHLAKYAVLMADLGVPSIRYTGNFWNLMLQNTRAHVDDVRALIRVAKLRFPERKILFASWSNGGCYLYEALLKARREGDAELASAPLAGALFDSTPCYMNLGTAAAAASGGIKSPVGRALMYWLFVALIGFLYVLVGVGLVADRPRVFWNSLLGAPARYPELYLYSSSDEITPADKLREFIAARRAQGVDLAAVDFSTSPHVGHLRAFPERYRREVGAFLERAAGVDIVR